MILVSGLLAASAPAALVWQGGGDLYTESSWLDDSGSVPVDGSIDGNIGVTADAGSEKLILIASGTSSPTNFMSNFHVANNSVTVSDGMVLSADNVDIVAGNGQLKSAWQGDNQILTITNGAQVQVGDIRNFGTVFVDNSTLTLTRYITTSSSTGFDLAITNGSTFSASYMSGYANATVDGSSSVTLTDASNPLRNDIHLTEGAELVLANQAMFTTEGAQIFVDGVSYQENPSILKITGNTAIAATYNGPIFGSPFQSGMVLQRGKPIKVWGTADPTNEVLVSINGTTAAGMSDVSGNWMVELSALSAGGPYELQSVSNGETNRLTDVLVGDVWLAFGQSNMIRPLSEMTNKQTYIDDITTNRMIRCLEVAQDAALTPQESGSMTWRDNSNPGGWSSVAAVFAHQMHAGNGVPTAVIWAGWGSSSIEGWMPIQMTDDFPHFDGMMDQYQSIGEYADGTTISSRVSGSYSSNLEAITAMVNGTGSWDDIFIRTRPNIIYNQRIHPLLDFGISGFVWYQGEANAGTPENVAQYGFTLPAFVTEYRELFNQGDLPFLGVQLPSYNSTYWAWFRESQNQLTTLSNAYVAVTIDTGLANNIHPYDKEPIGQRLALLGRKYALGQSIEAHGPTFESMSISGSDATISFSHASGLTTDDTLDPAEFELAGADQLWHDATSSSISGTNVIISSTSVSTPVAVRYAWSPAPVNTVNLINSDGLPAAPFRTDDWAMPDLGVQAPTAVNDSFSVVSNELLSVPVPGILGNDIDLNRDSLSASLVDDVSYGTLSLAVDGSFTYTADTGFAGYDSFRYAASDGALSATATVTIFVQGNLEGGELILNGDFETNDGATGGNSFAGFSSWIGYLEGDSSPDLRNDLGNEDDVVGDSIMIRLATTSTTGDKGFYQDFSVSWDSSSKFTIGFNASEVWWKAGGSNNDGVTVSLGDQDGGNKESVYLNLDGSYDAANAPYVTWISNQTHELTFTGAELITAGVTADEDLRFDLSSTFTGSGNSIVWVDNISVILVEAAVTPEFTPGEVTVSNENLVVSFTGTVGSSYHVESAEDLSETNAWTTVTNWSSLPASPMEVALSTTNPAAFYRITLSE
jgi:sialate O-acetylesterase